MSQIRRGAESFVNKCGNCDHSELDHTKITKKDQSRISTSKPYLSNCKRCDCKEFKSKSKSKIKGLFKK